MSFVFLCLIKKKIKRNKVYFFYPSNRKKKPHIMKKKEVIDPIFSDIIKLKKYFYSVKIFLFDGFLRLTMLLRAVEAGRETNTISFCVSGEPHIISIVGLYPSRFL